MNNTKLNDLWVTIEIREEIKKFLDTAKGILRGKFTAISAYIKKRERERSFSSNLMMYLNLLEKQEQTKPKTSRWKETIKITKINEIETKKTIQRINETKS
jgi:hypothetical protein